MKNKNSLIYIKTMYGEKSQEYRIAKILHNITEKLIENKKLILEKECKSEICRYEIYEQNSDNLEDSIIILKMNKPFNKKDFNLKNKTIVELSKENRLIEINKLVNSKIYSLIIKGYKLL